MTGDRYEAEIRLGLTDRGELDRILPGIGPSLNHEYRWETTFHGRNLFLAGALLRISRVRRGEHERHYLCWKGPDQGGFANIREELDEEITDGVVESLVLKRLGGSGGIRSATEAAEALVCLGQEPFMRFAGRDQYGLHEASGLRLKLMSCPALPWPLLLEVEKLAGTLDEARRAEAELRDFVTAHGLETRLVREEPPALLYKTLCKGF